MSASRKKFIRRKNTLDRHSVSRYIKLYHSEFSNKSTTRNIIEKVLGISISPSLFSNAFDLYKESINRTSITVNYSSCVYCKELASCVRTQECTFKCTSCGVEVHFPTFELTEDSTLIYTISPCDPEVFEDNICLSDTTGESEEEKEQDDYTRDFFFFEGGGRCIAERDGLLGEEQGSTTASGHPSGGSAGDKEEENQKTLEDIIPTLQETEDENPRFQEESFSSIDYSQYPLPPSCVIPFESQDYLSQQ